MRQALKWLALAALPIAAAAQSQQKTIVLDRSQAAAKVQEKSFVLDHRHPFVWIEFDHAGKSKWNPGSPPAATYWLRLHNNCSQWLRIIVNGDPADALPGERTVQFSTEDDSPDFITAGVVPDATVKIELDGTLNEPHQVHESAQQAETQKTDEAAVDRNPGYRAPDFGSPLQIAPGESVLFRVPANAVGASWHVRVNVSFVGAEISGPHVPVTFKSYELPDSEKVTK